MKHFVIPQVDSNMSHPLCPFSPVTPSIRKKQQVSALQLFFFLPSYQADFAGGRYGGEVCKNDYADIEQMNYSQIHQSEKVLLPNDKVLKDIYTLSL